MSGGYQFYMMRFVAVVLLALLGTVHAWAGVDGRLSGRAFLAAEYTAGHAGQSILRAAGYQGITGGDTSILRGGHCCSRPVMPVVSNISQCTFDSVIVADLSALVCPDPAQGATGFKQTRSMSDGTGTIFRPPII